MNSLVNIRKLHVDDDYMQYLNLLKQLTTINPNAISHDEFRQRLHMICGNPNHIIYVATLNNTIVGSITVLIEPKFIHDLSYVSHIEDVVVDKSARLHGIGKQLVDTAIIASKQAQCYKIILDCSDDNVSFYGRSGFVVKEKQMVIYT